MIRLSFLTDLSFSTIIPLQNATVHGVQHDPITYFSTFPLPVNGSLPIFATSNDTTVVDDACNPLPASTPDLSKFLVIIRRGTCTFVSRPSLLSSHILQGHAGAKVNKCSGQGRNSCLNIRVCPKDNCYTFFNSSFSNGVDFADITVGNFEAVLIQADDGVFVRLSIIDTREI